MAGRELTAALALLLSDSVLRARFISNPHCVAQELELSPLDTAVLSALDPAGLEAQAQALLNKRRREASRLVPQTWRLLGTALAATAFAAYAARGVWPEGHQRHTRDAVGFMRWLMQEKLPYSRLELLRNEQRLTPYRTCLGLLWNTCFPFVPALYAAWRWRGQRHERLLHIGPWSG